MVHTALVGSAVIIIGVLCVQAVTGTVWWAFARRGRTISALEAVGMGLATGTFASMVSAMLFSRTAIGGVAWALPAVLTAVAIVASAMVQRLTFARLRLDAREVIGLAIGLAAGLVILASNWARVPLSSPIPRSSADLYFFEALSRGLAEFGPAESILMSGGALRYHWFTYAWAGELAQTSSSPAFVSITRVLPLVTLIGVCMLATAWAARKSSVRWVPSLAALLVVGGGYAGGLYGSILNFDSPSQSMTTMWLIALALAFIAVVEGSAGRASGLVVIAGLASACTGGKVSHAAVAAGGVALVSGVALVTRAPTLRRTVLAAVVAAAAMGLTYAWVLAGVAVSRNLTEDLAVKASTWQGLDPLAGPLGVALGTAALALAVLARLAGIGWLLGRSRSRRWPDTLFALGAVGVGIAAMVFLREGVNELWFVLAASGPAAIVSAVGVGEALRWVARGRGGLHRPLLWAGSVAAPASLTCLMLSANWSDHRSVLNWLAPVSVWILVPVAALMVAAGRRPRGRIVLPAIALSVAALTLTSIMTRPSALWTSSRPITTESGSVSPDSGLSVEVGAANPSVQDPGADLSWTADAAAWLTANSGNDDLVVTTDPLAADVPAYTGRQMYLAGELYQIGLGQQDELPTIRERHAVSVSLASGLTDDARAALCSAGVDWVWFAGDALSARSTGLPVSYTNEGVTLLRLPAGSCATG